MTVATDTINTAFASNKPLCKRIFDAISETPQHSQLFEDIAKYQLTSHREVPTNGNDQELNEQVSKKRKLADGTAAANNPQSDQARSVILEARDISFTLPQRKKLHLSIVQYGTEFQSSATTFAICARNPATSQVEFEYPTNAFAYALRAPVPEKAQKQYNFCLLPSPIQSATNPVTSVDAVIWTVNHGPLKSCQVLSDDLQAIVGEESILENALDAVLQRSNNKLVYPSESEFVSALVESHRKNDKAYHVKAFRGSKDGFLFFLENGIFFGFKKPLAFFPFDDIDSVSYTAVLQRTFNLVIVVRTADEAETQEIEFSMMDQADFAGIDIYLKRHQLQDSSMAEARRAKKFNVNGAKGAAIEAVGDDGQTELQRAEQELEDEEDEMEEDYDPGSDDDSEGSGFSDEDDDSPQKGGAKDLVKDELGSEAEDVEITDDEEEDDVDEDEQEIVVQHHAQQPHPQQQKALPKMPLHTKSVVLPMPLTQSGMPDFDDDDQL